jgi:hypothetical protein
LKIKEQTIQALDRLTTAELILVNEWIARLCASRCPADQRPERKISYDQMHAVTRRCASSFSDEIIRQREDRM